MERGREFSERNPVVPGWYHLCLNVIKGSNSEMSVKLKLIRSLYSTTRSEHSDRTLGIYFHFQEN